LLADFRDEDVDGDGLSTYLSLWRLADSITRSGHLELLSRESFNFGTRVELLRQALRAQAQDSSSR